MRAVMYHYVRPNSGVFPYLKFLHLDDFKAQLDYFAETDRFISREEFLSVLAGESPTNDGILLTFDDGLKDHVDYVLPELIERGIWAIFYVPSGPYRNQKLLDVHRSHCLLGKFGSDTIAAAAKELVSNEMLSHDHVREFHTETYARQENPDSAIYFKRLINYFISYEWRTVLLDKLTQEFLSDELIEDIDSYYVPLARLRELTDQGMLVGSHGDSHPVMSKLTVAQQQNEILTSFRFLEDNLGEIDPLSFCYPHGGYHTFTKDTERLLSHAGCKFSFNVEERAITADDIRLRPQALPRYDCNQFPYGKPSEEQLTITNPGK